MKDLLQGVFGEFYGNIIYVLLDATQWTIYLSLTAFVGGGLIALGVTLARVGPSRAVRFMAAAYIWLFQSIPLLMLLFLTGLGIPVYFQIDVPPWLAASVSLIVFTSAYLAEVWRGAIDSLPDGQWEAGTALGFGFWRVLRLIIVPQAVRISLPPTVGFMVQIIKGTSLAYIIDFHDVMRWGKRIANAQLDGAEPFVIFPLVALIYFLLCFPLTSLSRYLERRVQSQTGRAQTTVVNLGA